MHALINRQIESVSTTFRGSKLASDVAHKPCGLESFVLALPELRTAENEASAGHAKEPRTIAQRLSHHASQHLAFRRQGGGGVSRRLAPCMMSLGQVTLIELLGI